MICREKDKTVVELTLGKSLSGTILTVYLHTNIMVIISQATNFFKPFFFEAVITVNLTIILVVCTMFLAIAQMLPTTSYMKILDLWFIAVLIILCLYPHLPGSVAKLYQQKNSKC